MSSSEALVDALTLRQIFIGRYSKSEAKRLAEHLKKMSDRLKETIKSDYDRVRAVRLARKVSQIAEALLTVYGDDLIAGLRELASEEAEFARQAILNSTAATAVQAPTFNQIQAALTKKKMSLIGKTVKRLTIAQAVRHFSRSKAREIGNLIRDGATTGKTSAEIIKQIDELETGRTRHQSDALVRTLTNHVASTARAATYTSNDDVITGEEYTAVLDSRTTITCSSLDGQVFNIGEGPQPPLHWSCRSVRVPVVNPDYDLGSAIVGERASVDGPVSVKVTYGGWLKRQSNAIQDEVLGVERAILFRSGKLSIAKFTDDAGKVYTLDQLRKLNPLVFSD